MAAPAPVQRKAVTLVVVAVAARSGSGTALKVLRWLLRTRILVGMSPRDEGRQSFDLVALLDGLLHGLRSVVVVLRLARKLLLPVAIADRERLGVAWQKRLRIAGAEARLAASHGRLLPDVVALALAIVALGLAVHVVSGVVVWPIELRVALAELLLRGRDQAEIMFGVLVVVFRRNGIAR